MTKHLLIGLMLGAAPGMVSGQGLSLEQQTQAGRIRFDRALPSDQAEASPVQAAPAARPPRSTFTSQGARKKDVRRVPSPAASSADYRDRSEKAGAWAVAGLLAPVAGAVLGAVVGGGVGAVAGAVIGTAIGLCCLVAALSLWLGGIFNP